MKRAKRKIVRRKKKRSGKSAKIFFRLKIAAIALSGLILVGMWNLVVSSNINISDEKTYFLVSDSLDAADLLDSLENREIIKSRISAQIYYELFGSGKIRPGLYTIRKEWNNFDLFKHLQEDSLPPYRQVYIPPYRLRKNVIEEIAEQLKHDKSIYWQKVRDEKFLDSIGGFTKENIFCIFRPGVYHVYEGTGVNEFLDRMVLEYNNFWTKKRRRKADRLDLTPEQVTALASIVYSETKLKEEMPLVAGVYINRLKKNMRLQSDPTVVYAANKFGARRVYNVDKRINSPYNTYRYKGLPPGPIHNVPGYVIDMVLDYEDHDYLYFCAKDDLSGCHLFSETYDEHKKNARRYRKALNRAGIY